MTDSIAHFFRPINHTFLDKEWHQGFTVYYKSIDGSRTNYLQFAQYTPADYTRLERIMREGDRQEFFIHENDLFRYYKQCALVRLKETLEADAKPSLDIVQLAYPVVHRVMSDYLDFDTSPRLLRVLDDLPGIIQPLFRQGGLTLPGLVRVTRKDASLQTHCTNTGFYCLCMGQFLKMTERELKDLLLGGLLADIGKKGFIDTLENKEEELTPEDKREIRKHPTIGRKVLNDMRCYSDNILRMAAEHHENYDGTGYPFGREGGKISLFARIFRIMDVFNALTCHRPYRTQLNPVKALVELRDQSPGQFDQDLLASLFRSLTPA
ncbi:MAG: HD-GYP domain-containing protein [Nitrospinaceae bacterium]